MRKSYFSGLAGEWQAAGVLRRAGCRIVAKRYRAAGGEVDLIARDGETLVFAEVKYRPSGRPGEGMEAVNGDKRRRLRAAARVYMSAHGGEDVPVRFDVVEITRAGARHVKDAF